MTVPVQRRTVGTLLQNHDERILALERERREQGCCPGPWIDFPLEAPWDDAGAPYCDLQYRWGPHDQTDDTVTVDDAGIEFRGQAIGGTSGSVLGTFPEEDRFSCDKDFLVLVLDEDGTMVTEVVGAAHIDFTTGEMTVEFPI